MAHYIDNKKIVFNSSIVIKDGKQSDDYILVSDANGLAYWDTRTNYISTKEFDHYVGEWFGGGVVVAVWRDNGQEKCLVAAPQDCSYLGTDRFSDSGPSGPFDNIPFLGFTVPWSNVATTANGASWSVSGASNSNIIVSQAGFSTTINPFVNGETSTLSGFSGAAQYALNYINPDLGTGVFNDWYLPAAHEILALWNNASVVNKVLVEYSAYNSISTDIPSFPPLSLINPMINFFESRGDDDNYSYDQGYWTSTQASPTEAYYLSQDGSLKRSPKNPSQGSYYLNYKRVRPFRIASDSQVSFNFDAEYIIITYRYFDGKDLETLTRMISPSFSTVPGITPWNENVAYSAGVNGGTGSSNYVGYWAVTPWGSNGNFTPNSYPLGTYSILWWGGDNQGFGSNPSAYETVLININAFKFHYPGQNIVRIDCRGHWFSQTGQKPVRLAVDMYKGGQPIKNGPVYNSSLIWENPTATSKLNLDALDVLVTAGISNTGKTPEGLYDSDRIAVFEFNIVTKTGKIIKQ